MICNHCNHVITGFEKRCPNCGHMLENTLDSACFSQYIKEFSKRSEETQSKETVENEKQKGRHTGKKNVRTVAVMIVILILSVIGVRWYQQKGEPLEEDTCFYTTKDHAYLTSATQKQTIELAEGTMVQNDYEYENTGKVISSRNSIQLYTSESEEGKEQTLYYIENNTKAKPIIIADDVTYYSFTYEDTVLYTTKYTTSIYEYDFENTTVWKENAKDLLVSSDGKYVLYGDEAEQRKKLIFLEEGKEYDVGPILGEYQYSSDFHILTYLYEGEIHYCEILANNVIEECIASNVKEFFGHLTKDNMTIYYLEDESHNQVTAYQYVDDPYLEDDSSSEVESEEQAYRNEIRKELKSMLLDDGESSLYCYVRELNSGNSEQVLLDKNCSHLQRCSGTKEQMELPVVYSVKSNVTIANQYAFDATTNVEELINNIQESYYSTNSIESEKSYLVNGSEKREILLQCNLLYEEGYLYWCQVDETGSQFSVCRIRQDVSSFEECEVCFLTKTELLLCQCSKGFLIYSDYDRGGEVKVWSSELGECTVLEEGVFIAAESAKDDTIYMNVVEDNVMNLYRLEKDGTVTFVVRDSFMICPISYNRVYAIVDYDYSDETGSLIVWEDGVVDRLKEEVSRIGKELKDLYVKENST